MLYSSMRMGRDPEAVSMLEGLSRRLKIARQMKIANIEDIARASGCSKGLISRVENGKCFVSLPMLTRLAAALDVEVSWLLEGSPDDTPKIMYSRSKLEVQPSCIDKASAEIQKSFGQTSWKVKNIHITGSKVISSINSPDNWAACLVLSGTLHICSKNSYVHVKSGGFFETFGMEDLTYRSASKEGVSLIVIAL